MESQFRMLPEQASSFAAEVDSLYFFLAGMTALLSGAIAALIVFFSVRYRRSATVNRDRPATSLWMEIAWLIGPLPVLLFIFYWGASLYFRMQRAPADCMEVSVTARQWMWKFQHPQGRREIDELHVPEGRPVRLTMISQDVIHSLYVPAFRVKQDVLPGRYSSLWFSATKPGEYNLFCAEYCGANHSSMIGKVYVLSPRDYQDWLSGAAGGDPPHVAGEKLFAQLRCDSCHRPPGEAGARGPSLAGLFQRPVALATGQSFPADDDYVRESILRPNARLRAGFQPLMPTFEGQVTEEALMQLVAYIKSLPAAGENGP